MSQTLTPVATVDSDLVAQVGRRPLLDPRTTTALVITANLVALSPHSPFLLVAILGIVVIALLLLTKKWGPVSKYIAVVLVFAAFLGMGYLPNPNPVTATFGVLGYYLLRFTVLYGAGMFLLYCATPTELIAALRRLHLPNILLIPLAVMMRFIPTIMREGKHILDSMRVRQVVDSSWKVMLHPVKAIEYLVVPLISSTLRIAQDLSASALLRGLGSNSKPTTISRLGLGLFDLVVLLFCVGMLTAWALWKYLPQWIGPLTSWWGGVA